MKGFLKRWTLIVIFWAAIGIEVFGINCPPLKRPNHGFLTYAQGNFIGSHCEYPEGTLATLHCEEFYVAMGEEKSECLRDGNWTNSLTCYPDCGRSSKMVSLVVHGSEASPGFFPWHAAIYYRGDSGFDFWCGGSLISDNVVLTAAHCTWQVKAENLRIVVGKFYKDYEINDINSQIVRVRDIETLASYQDALGNYNSDISMIFLERPVELNIYVSPVCIDWDQFYIDEQLQEGIMGKVVGWGLTENDTFSNILRVVSLPVVSDEHCISQQSTVFRKYITYTTFCAGYDNGTSVCNGDSGGGLVFFDEDTERWFIQGVVSVSPRRKGTSLCDPYFYAIFTKVSIFTKWLKSFNIFDDDYDDDENDICQPYK